MAYKYFCRYFEIAVWITALITLALMNPAADRHFSLCAFKWMGFEFCPGCGLGHSITWLFRGEFMKSFNEHPLGLVALAVLLHRIFTLIKNKRTFITA